MRTAVRSNGHWTFWQGTMAGATLWGRLADACGRRVGFFGTAVFTFAFGLASAGSPNYAVRAPVLQRHSARRCSVMVIKATMVQITASLCGGVSTRAMDACACDSAVF